MHPSHPPQHQSVFYPNQPPAQRGPQLASKPPWHASTPTPTPMPDSSFQTYTTSHTLQRPQLQLSSPFPHGSDTAAAAASGGALHSSSSIWTSPASMPRPGASDTSNPPYQSPSSLSLSHNYPPPPHLTNRGGGHPLSLSNSAQPALPYLAYPSRAIDMDADQYASLQSATGGATGVLRNQPGRPSSSVVPRAVAGHPYVPHTQGTPPFGLHNRASGMLTTGRRHLGSRTAKADDGSEGEYGDSDVDLEGPMKRTDGHNLSTHERRRLYVSALETYITDTTSTMRSHGLEPPSIQRCVDNRGLTSDARLTMMASLDDEIKHLQQEIEEAEQQRRQLQTAVETQQEAAQ